MIIVVIVTMLLYEYNYYKTTRLIGLPKCVNGNDKINA